MVYQEDGCNLDFFSRLQDDDVRPLMALLASGARMAAWRLHQFTDEHTAELQAILNGWLLEEPCCYTAQLALVAYRHWLYVRNPAIAETVLMHSMRPAKSSRLRAARRQESCASRFRWTR